MFGNIQRKKGKVNSIKGTMMKMENGTIRNISATVRLSVLFSCRVSSSPRAIRISSSFANFMSIQNILQPSIVYWTPCLIEVHTLEGFRELQEKYRSCALPTKWVGTELILGRAIIVVLKEEGCWVKPVEEVVDNRGGGVIVDEESGREEFCTFA